MSNNLEKGVTVVAKTTNIKTGDIAVTWSNKHTCPKRCPFIGVCYPNYGTASFVTKKLDASTETDPDKLAKTEAELIDKLNTKKLLRLKVYGDCPTRKSARTIADAALRYQNRNNQKAYGYTHAWDKVKPEDWKGISVLASCETPGEVKKCKENGWGTVITVDSFPNGKNMFDYHGIKVLPCPNQTVGVQCKDCQLCAKADVLKKNDYSIGFKAHGTSRNSIINILKTKLKKEKISI
jgi:hypothetical protein